MNGLVAVFLDAHYVRKGAEDLLGHKGLTIRWRELSDALVGNRPHLRTYYYDAIITKRNAPDFGRFPPEEAEEKRREFTDLVNERYTDVRNIDRIPYFAVRLGHCRGRLPYIEQKGVDTRITLDMLDLSRKGAFSIAVLVSGDGDLAEVVERVTADGRHVELAFYQGSVNDRLHRASDMHRLLTKEFIAAYVE